MKLIDREPTQEMIAAGREALNLAKRISADEIPLVFSYMYDAAPEVKQEPVAIVGELYPQTKIKLSRKGIPVGAFLYTSPPDAQVEIAKRDARIAELEKHLLRVAENPEDSAYWLFSLQQFLKDIDK